MMTDYTARQFILSELEDDDIRDLHSYEIKNNRLEVPYAIHKHYRTRQVGEVPDEIGDHVQPICMAIWHKINNRAMAEAMKGGAFSEVKVTHEADWEIWGKGIDFKYAVQGRRLKAKT